MNQKVLLIADDIEMNRTVISKFLKSEYTVLQAEDGEEALRVLESTHVDVLLLDIIMPKMDGVQVLEHIQKNEKLKGLGILVATSTKEKTERKVLALGADDIVSKPYDPIIIQKRLENILAVKEIKQQGDMSGNERVEFLLSEEKERLRGHVQEQLDTLLSIYNIVEQNASNERLVKELAGNMKIEIKQIADLLK